MYYGPGGAAAEDWSPEETLQLMFPAIVHRGHHAWGYMYYNPETGAIEWYKSSGAATNREALDEMIVDTKEPAWLVGHVRYATKGTPRESTNNHPILHRNIIGVHNGVLYNDVEILRETGRENPITEVDSEAIFAAINKWGTNKGLARVRGDMVAAYSHTKHPRILRLARSHGRPLVYGYTKGGAFVFASEQRVLDDAGIVLVDDKAGKSWWTTNQVMRIDLKPGDESISIQESAFASPYTYSAPKSSTAPISTKKDNKTTPTTYTGGFAADIGVTDSYGGTYLGQNRWRVVLNGVTIIKSANEYIKWVVDREVAARMRRIHEAAQRAKAKREEQADSTKKEVVPFHPTPPAPVPAAPVAEQVQVSV